ncbi:MAG: hypothetical protein J1E57_10005 [Prevotella sp.]|nr:hypothetical protein [Prevotella sp.]
MKKRLEKLFVMLLMIALTTACSENATMKHLLEQIPAESDVVMVGNVKIVVESAGGSLEGSELKLPSFIKDKLTDSNLKDYEEMNKFLSKSGIDSEACALVGNYDKNCSVLLFSLSDKDKFIDVIKEDGFNDSGADGNVAVYSKKSNSFSDDYGYIAINDTYAYWIDRIKASGDFNPGQYLQDMIKKSKEKNYAETIYGEYITDANAFGIAIKKSQELNKSLRNTIFILDVLSVYDGVVCMRGNLSGDKFTLDFKQYDKDGKEIGAEQFKELMDVTAKIDDDALDMLGENEFLVYASSLKNVNWDKYTEIISQSSNLSRSNRAQINAMQGYFKKIDGTVAMGFGLTNGLESVRNLNAEKEMLSQFSTTMVVETKEEDAKQLINEMKEFLKKLRIPYEDSESGLSVDMKQMGLSGSLYVKNKGNLIALANHPIQNNSKNVVAKSMDLDDYLFALGIVLKKDNKLMQDLKLPNDVKLLSSCASKTLETKMTLEINGGDKEGVIAKAAKIILSLADYSEKL